MPETNKVLRRYALTGSINGRPIEDATVTLRYSEAEALALPRDSQSAIDEALKVARRRGLVPTGVAVAVECTGESLRRDKR